MANTIRIKRRTSGAAGAPSVIANAELAFNEVDDILYYGEGTSGENGTGTALAIAGPGAFLTLTSSQTVTGNKTFSGTLSVATPTDNTHAATKLYVDTAVTGVATTFRVSDKLPAINARILNGTISSSFRSGAVKSCYNNKTGDVNFGTLLGH
jgi:hypothetical protein